MPTTKKNTGLKNPAATAVAASQAGHQVVKSGAEITSAAAKEGISLLSLAIKAAMLYGAGWYLVGLFKKRFIAMKTNPSYPGANISSGQAHAKANAIYEAMRGFGADVDIVATQLAGLNYNGWVLVFNAFGNRKGANPLGDPMDLVEWLNDQFDADEMAQLRFLVQGVFRGIIEPGMDWPQYFLIKRV